MAKVNFNLSIDCIELKNKKDEDSIRISYKNKNGEERAIIVALNAEYGPNGEAAFEIYNRTIETIPPIQLIIMDCSDIKTVNRMYIPEKIEADQDDTKNK